MEDNPIGIDVKDLQKTYKTKTGLKNALKKVSFDIEVGQICCLLGPNGSGKTTLLKILAGLVAADAGNLSIMGVDPVQNPILARQQVGWMPAEERSGFYGRLSAKENLNFFATLQKIPPKEMERVIGNIALLLGIGDEIDQTILTLSAGEKQKIGLARTLLHNPPVLLLDEPFRNLDPHTVVRFRRLLKDHLTRVQKKTIILSTHQLEEAEKIADTVLIIHEGKILKHLSARDLKKEMKKDSVENFYLHTIDQVEHPN